VPPLREAVREHLAANPNDTWHEAVMAFADEMDGGD